MALKSKGKVKAQSAPLPEVRVVPRVNARRIGITKKRVLEARALELKRAGISLEVIADDLGISLAGAGAMLRRGLARHAAIDFEYVRYARALDIERTEALLGAIWKYAMGEEKRTVVTAAGPITIKEPSIDHIKAARLLIRDRRELIGEDAPKRVEADITTHSPIDDEISKLLAKRDAKKDGIKASADYTKTIEADASGYSLIESGSEVSVEMDVDGEG